MSMFLFVIILIGLITTQLSSSWYSIYFSLAIVNLIGITVLLMLRALAKNLDIPEYDVYGSAHQARMFLITVTSMFILGIGLSEFLGSISSTFSILPVTTQSIGVLTGATILNLFIVVFVAPILENGFTYDFFQSFMTVLLEKVKLGPVLLMLGIVTAFILYNIALYVGIVIIALGIVVALYEQTQKISLGHEQPRLYIVILAVLFSAVMIAALHTYALSAQANFQSAILWVFIFFASGGVLNLMFKNRVAALVFHSSFNAGVFSILFNVSIIICVVVELLFIFYIYVIDQPGIIAQAFERTFNKAPKRAGNAT